MRLAVFALAAVLTPVAASAAQVSALGTWSVTGVEADRTMPVTAVGDGDPAYMGAELSVTPTRIVWNTGATNGEGTYDDCASPRLVASGPAISVMCGGEAWGPEATLTPLSADRLRLDWYDGGILTLTRK